MKKHLHRGCILLAGIAVATQLYAQEYNALEVNTAVPQFQDKGDDALGAAPSRDTQYLPSVNGEKHISVFNINELNRNVIDEIDIRDKSLNDVLNLFSSRSDLLLVNEAGLEGKITVYLKNVDVKDALRVVVDTNNLALSVEDIPVDSLADGVTQEIIRIMSRADFKEKFGYAFGQKLQTKVMPLRFSQADHLMEILDQMKSESGKVVYNEKSNTLILIDLPESIRDMELFITEADVPMETEIFDLKNIKAGTIKEDLGAILTKNIGRLQFDERSSNVVVTDTQKKIEAVAQLLETLQKQDREIMIESKVMQIVLSDEHLSGVDWEAIVSNFQQLEVKAVPDEEDNNGATLSLGTITDEDYVVLMEALEAVGEVNTINTQKALIHEADLTEVNVLSKGAFLSSAKSLKGNLQPVQEYTLYLLTKEKMIDLEEEESKVPEELFEVFINAGNESLFKEKLVDVSNGSTIILGSYFKDVKIEHMRKIPLLGDLPFLGFAFRHQGIIDRKSEVIVFITIQWTEQEETSVE